jgi:hypothetical protein
MVVVDSIYLRFYIAVGVGSLSPTLIPSKIPSDSDSDSDSTALKTAVRLKPTICSNVVSWRIMRRIILMVKTVHAKLLTQHVWISYWLKNDWIILKTIPDNFLTSTSWLTQDFDEQGRWNSFSLSTNNAITLPCKKFNFVCALQVKMFDAHNCTVLSYKQIQKCHKTCAFGLEIHLPFLILKNAESPVVRSEALTCASQRVRTRFELCMAAYVFKIISFLMFLLFRSA